ncbi:MAG: helix-turn-helix transcriptional regulator [Capsulimonas sp.]|uniref:helix-turn-helix transcriptional regulator n=1 Tax=Capsulimonas sp. TaxID=2494211 RepID=UPI003264D793
MKRIVETRASVGSVAKVVFRRAVTLHQVISRRTTIVIVRRGTMEVAHNGKMCCARHEHMIVIPAGMAFDITYRPDEDSRFAADWLIPYLAEDQDNAPPEDMAASQWLPRPIDAGGTQFRQSLDCVIKAIKEPKELPDVIAIHHVQELMLWIKLNGGCVRAAPASSESSRIWYILAADPMRDWNPFEVADRIGMSPSCLRIRLFEERTSFVRLLHEVRMGHALSEIVATNRPIHTIASEIGYRCTAHFSGRFYERYGLRPGDARGHDRSLRSGAASSRRIPAPALVLSGTHQAGVAGRDGALAPT